MIEAHDLAAGLAVFVGLVGILVVLLPGLLLQVAAVLLWALEEASAVAWTVLALVVAAAIGVTVLRFMYPGRQLKAAGIPGWLLLVSVGTAVVGLFVVPVVGAPLFFVAAIYLVERVRKGAAEAWPSTRRAVKAVLTSIGIELSGGFAILIVFVIGALLT